MKKHFILAMLAASFILVSCGKKEDNKPEEKIIDKEVDREKEETKEDIKPPKEGDVIEPTFVKGILIVNKKFPLPETYDPQEDPSAKAALLELIADAQKNNYDISDYYSGYRNYSLQNELYENYKISHGQEQADTFSARPGHSEHQTGLTFDLFHSDGAFVEREPEAEWVKNNAHRFGFIVRYQKGKESITGYQAEPWHLRYIGAEAEKIYSSKLTLEEYLGVEGGDYQ